MNKTKNQPEHSPNIPPITHEQTFKQKQNVDKKTPRAEARKKTHNLNKKTKHPIKKHNICSVVLVAVIVAIVVAVRSSSHSRVDAPQLQSQV